MSERNDVENLFIEGLRLTDNATKQRKRFFNSFDLSCFRNSLHGTARERSACTKETQQRYKRTDE